jgi:hypothetical protein
MTTVALALGALLALSAAGSNAEAQDMRGRPLIRVPVVKQDPYWVPDYNIVPRYRYRPQDDRVDTSPYAPPVALSDPEPGGIGIGQ